MAVPSTAVGFAATPSTVALLRCGGKLGGGTLGGGTLGGGTLGGGMLDGGTLHGDALDGGALDDDTATLRTATDGTDAASDVSVTRAGHRRCHRCVGDAGGPSQRRRWAERQRLLPRPLLAWRRL